MLSRSGTISEGEGPSDRAIIDRSGLEQKIAGGLAWSFFSYGIVQALNLARTVVLARILDPDDFGLFSLAVLVVGFLASFGEFGIPSLVIANHSRGRAYLTAALWLCVLPGSILVLSMLVLAGPISRYYGRPDLQPLLAVLACFYLIQFAGAFYHGYLRSRLRLRALMIATTTAHASGFLVAVALALCGFGASSYVWGLTTSGALLLLLMVWQTGWLPDGRPHLEHWSSILRFGIKFQATTLAAFALFNLSQFFVAQYFGTEQLGVYALAFSCAQVPMVIMNTLAAGALIPTLAMVREDSGAFALLFLKMSRWMTLAGSVGGACLLIAAPALFALLGQKWAESVSVFQILLPFAVLRSIYPDVLPILDRVSLSLCAAVLSLAALLPILLAAVRYDLQMVALGTMAVMGGSHLALLPWIARILRVPATRLWGNTLPILGAAGAALLAAQLVGLLGSHSPPGILLTIVQLAVILIAGLGAAVLVTPELRRDLLESRLFG